MNEETTIPIILSQPEAENMPEYLEQTILCLAIFLAQQHSSHVSVLVEILFQPLLEIVLFSDGVRDNYKQAEKIQAVFSQVEQKYPYSFDIQQVEEAYDNYDAILSEHVIKEISFNEDPLIVNSFYEFESYPQGRDEIYRLFTAGRVMKMLGTKLQSIIGNSISLSIQSSDIDILSEQGDTLDKEKVDMYFSAVAGNPRIKIQNPYSNGGIQGFIKQMGQ